jgi:eukaryotic-like serine/threonine-protein kinase
MPSNEGTLLGGRYHLEKLVARGGIAEVYRARDTGDGDATVAIKLIPAEAFVRQGTGERIEHAADPRLSPEHPSMVRVLGAGSLPDGRVYIVMDFVDGEDLRQRLAREGRLAPDIAIGILRGICAGVDAAHRAGIIHGDLKPENVMLPRDGSPARLVDFVGARRTTPDGTILGTPAYMAPEQLRGEPPCTRSDVFSLGVMAFEMLTGSLPFGRGHAGESLLQQARGVPPLPGVSACLEVAVRSALSSDPDRRPPSAAAFAQLLDSAC